MRQLQLFSDRDFTRDQGDAALDNSDLLPVLVVQRQTRRVKGWSGMQPRGYDTVDVPQYIWIQKGTSVSPEMVMDKVGHSIRQSLTDAGMRGSFDRDLMEKMADQQLLSFGTTMHLSDAAQPFTAEDPLLVRPEC